MLLIRCFESSLGFYLMYFRASAGDSVMQERASDRYKEQQGMLTSDFCSQFAIRDLALLFAFQLVTPHLMHLEQCKHTHAATETCTVPVAV
jgi:hypothetical protein